MIVFLVFYDDDVETILYLVQESEEFIIFDVIFILIFNEFFNHSRKFVNFGKCSSISEEINNSVGSGWRNEQ